MVFSFWLNTVHSDLLSQQQVLSDQNPYFLFSQRADMPTITMIIFQGGLTRRMKAIFFKQLYDVL